MTVRSPWAAPGPPCVTLLSFQSPPDPFRPALRYLATETDGQVLYLYAHTSLQKGSPLYTFPDFYVSKIFKRFKQRSCCRIKVFLWTALDVG